MLVLRAGPRVRGDLLREPTTDQDVLPRVRAGALVVALESAERGQ